MQILIAANVIFVILAIYFLVHTIRCTKRRRIVRAGGSFLSCVASLAIAAVAGLLLYTYYSYARLTAETIVSNIEFHKTGDNEYDARLMINGKVDRIFKLRGDEWQLDARIVTWSPPATILGLDPVYRLERLSGRFSEIKREQTEIRTVHALTEQSAIDIWTLAHRMPALLPGVDAYYGSATYVPMADGARYSISLSRDALIARPLNDAARTALGRWEPTGT